MTASRYLRYVCAECRKPRFTSAKVAPVRCYPCELDRRNLGAARLPSGRARAEGSTRREIVASSRLAPPGLPRGSL